MKFYYNIPFWFSCTNIVNSLSLKIEEKPEGNRTRTHLTSGRPLPIFNPSHFTNQPYIKMLFVLFWSYRLISYELNNSSYCACINQVAVVSETDMVFFYLQWNKTAGKQQKIIIVLVCVKTCPMDVESTSCTFSIFWLWNSHNLLCLLNSYWNQYMLCGAGGGGGHHIEAYAFGSNGFTEGVLVCICSWIQNRHICLFLIWLFLELYFVFVCFCLFSFDNLQDMFVPVNS